MVPHGCVAAKAVQALLPLHQDWHAPEREFKFHYSYKCNVWYSGRALAGLHCWVTSETCIRLWRSELSMTAHSSLALRTVHAHLSAIDSACFLRRRAGCAA
eukprot:1155152-Pelagomonas_calceolata.AAC.5